MCLINKYEGLFGILSFHGNSFGCFLLAFYHVSFNISGQKKSKRKTKKKSDRQGGKQNSQDDRSHGGDHGDTGERSLGASGVYGTGLEADLSGYTTWSKISSSESEWSDTEGGQGSKLRSICTKVRQCALSCFYWIAKVT